MIVFLASGVPGVLPGKRHFDESPPGKGICFWHVAMPWSRHKMRLSPPNHWVSVHAISVTSWRILKFIESSWTCLNMSSPSPCSCLGYPTKGQLKRKQTARFDRKYMVFENNYRRLEQDELTQMCKSFSGRTGVGAKRRATGLYEKVLCRLLPRNEPFCKEDAGELGPANSRSKILDCKL